MPIPNDDALHRRLDEQSPSHPDYKPPREPDVDGPYDRWVQQQIDEEWQKEEQHA